MTLAELIARYRVAANDTANPGFCSDEEIRDYLNEADAEAVIRGRMLRATAETSPDLCVIDAATGVAGYALHHAMYELSYIAWRSLGSATREPLVHCTREWMDRNVLYWRDMEPGSPRYLVQDGHSLQVVPPPERDGQLLLEGYCVPTSAMQDDSDTPSIPAVHHIQLIQWALYRAFSKPDAELFDPARAAMAESEFTRYFGARPDSDLRNDTRKDEPQHIVAWI